MNHHPDAPRIKLTESTDARNGRLSDPRAKSTKENTAMNYTYHQDPGHGWIQVPLSEIERLNITPSRYSYRDRAAAYLEEDCDAAKWIEAKRAAGEPYTITERHSNADSFIRNLPRF